MNENFWDGFEKMALFGFGKKKDGLETHKKDGLETHIHYIHTDGLSETDFGKLKASVAHIGDYRKGKLKEYTDRHGSKNTKVSLGGSSNWRDDALEHFHKENPHVGRDKVYAGRAYTLSGAGSNGQAVYISRLDSSSAENPLGSGAHLHGHFVGNALDDKTLGRLAGKHATHCHEKVAFWNGFEKRASEITVGPNPHAGESSAEREERIKYWMRNPPKLRPEVFARLSKPGMNTGAKR